MNRLTGLAVALSLALPAVASASEGETEWRAGLGAGLWPGSAMYGLEAGWLRNLTDFWGIGVSVRDRRFLQALPAGIVAATADVRFVIDALTWIPAIELGGGAAFLNSNVVQRSTGETVTDASAYLRAEAVLGYRPARDWGVCLHVGLQRYGGTDGTYFGGMSLNYVWYRGSGIGLDL